MAKTLNYTYLKNGVSETKEINNVYYNNKKICTIYYNGRGLYDIEQRLAMPTLYAEVEYVEYVGWALTTSIVNPNPVRVKAHWEYRKQGFLAWTKDVVTINANSSTRISHLFPNPNDREYLVDVNFTIYQDLDTGPCYTASVNERVQSARYDLGGESTTTT